jgi:class 3 adenylate cyclase
VADDRVLATVLFTDIVNSTGRLAEIGDRDWHAVLDVHIGARVSALAGSSDVLVSSTLRDLVIGSGLEFEERGAHELKGVPGEWRLFAVASP